MNAVGHWNARFMLAVTPLEGAGAQEAHSFVFAHYEEGMADGSDEGMERTTCSRTTPTLSTSPVRPRG